MELLHVADAVAREKLIERDEVLEAMEQAIQKAGRSKYGLEHDIRAHINRKTGEIELRRFLEVVEERPARTRHPDHPDDGRARSRQMPPSARS